MMSLVHIVILTEDAVGFDSFFCSEAYIYLIFREKNLLGMCFYSKYHVDIPWSFEDPTM